MIVNDSGHVFAATENGLFKTVNNGSNWIKINTGPPGEYVQILVLNNSGDIFYGTQYQGVYKSTGDGLDWQEKNKDMTDVLVQSFCFNYGYIFAGAREGVFRSADNGDTWIRAVDGMDGCPVSSLTRAPNGYIFAGATTILNRTLFRSTNDGQTWQEVSNGLPSSYITCGVTNSSGDIFVGCEDGVFKSQNYGDKWDAKNNGLSNTDVKCLAVNTQDYIYAGTSFGGLFFSNDQGETWTDISIPNNFKSFLSLKVSHSGYIFAAVEEKGIYLSSNNGSDWERIHPSYFEEYFPIAVNSDGFIYSNTQFDGLHRYFPGWEELEEFRAGLGFADILALEFDDQDRLFAGTREGLVYRTIDVTTALQRQTTVPGTFYLSQNYPNPFNSNTNFEFRSC